MPTSIRAHLATQPSLESLATLADRQSAASQDLKIMGLIEDISKRLERLETSGAKKKHFTISRLQPVEATFVKSPAFPDVNAKPFITNASQNQASQQGVFPVNEKVSRPIAPPPDRQQNNTSTLFNTDNSQVCYYQTFGDKVRMCRTLASGEPLEARHDHVEVTLPQLSLSRLLYIADKSNKCKYLIATGAAVSAIPESCANGTADTCDLSLDAANNTTIILPTVHAN